MKPAHIQSLWRFFECFGYAVFASIIIALLLEFGAFLVLSVHHWIRPGPQVNSMDTSPAYLEYPWASEFWKEEESREKSHRAVYEPFRIWGVVPWHGRYINTDETRYGLRRRTIDSRGPDCEERASIDIWFFGGSTVFGTGVPDWATLPSFLSRSLNSAGMKCGIVTNFGTEGYVTNQEVILLTEQLKLGHRPDVVIFYDGVNDAYVGAVSPGDPHAHLYSSTIKARVEGSLASRLDFLRDSYALRLVRSVVMSIRRRSRPSELSETEIESKAKSTVDNYEANLRLIRMLSESYSFRVFCFWQPGSVSGHKPLHPFETKIPGNDPSKISFHILNTVYQHAERRATSDHNFVFLGHIFDSVKDPIYLDWMHLSPQGNELVARVIANVIEDSLKLLPLKKREDDDKENEHR